MTRPSEPTVDTNQTSPAGDPGPAREPAWRAAILGWLAAQALLAAPTPPPAGGPAAEGPPAGGDPLPARSLRSWPGIGQTRALAIAAARWEHPPEGPPLYLSDVPGIGAATERGVRRWLERRGAGGGSGR